MPPKRKPSTSGKDGNLKDGKKRPPFKKKPSSFAKRSSGPASESAAPRGPPKKVIKAVPAATKKRPRDHADGGTADGAATKLPANKRRAKRLERASGRPHFDIVQTGKTIWNELRLKTCTKARRAELVEQLHEGLRGTYREIALKHDASRLVQAVVQHGNDAHRTAVLQELASSLVELSRSPYAHFVVTKLIECSSTRALQQQLYKALKGHVYLLAVHSIAARVVELALASLRGPLAASLRLELYGREFAVFLDEVEAEMHADGGGRPGLAKLVRVRPDRKRQILDTVHALCQRFVEKGLLHFQYVHEILHEFIAVCLQEQRDAATDAGAAAEEADPGTVTPMDVEEEDEEEEEEAARFRAGQGEEPEIGPTLKTVAKKKASVSQQLDELLASMIDHTMTLLSTRAGTHVVAEAVTHGGAKERRRVMKAMKGHVVDLLTHRDAYLAVMRLVDVADDTVAVQKTLLTEVVDLNPAAPRINANPSLDEPSPTDGAGGGGAGESGVVPLMQVVSHRNGAKFFLRALAPDNHKYLGPEELCVFERASTTSKKDAEVRRLEVIAFLREPLEALIVADAAALMCSRPGSAVLLECMRTWQSDAVVAAVAEAAVAPLDGDAAAADGGAERMFEHAVGHLCLKKLLLQQAATETESGQAPSADVSLAAALLQRLAPKGSATLDWFEANRGAIVLWALLQVPSAGKELRSRLKPRMSAIRAKAKTSKGAQQLLDGLTSA